VSVETYNWTNLPEATCSTPVADWHFLLRDDLKHGLSFHAGLFFDRWALGDGVHRYPRERRFCALLESPIDNAYCHLDTLKRRFPVIVTHQDRLLAQGPPYSKVLFGTNWVQVYDEADLQALLSQRIEKTGIVSFMGSIQHSPDRGAYGLREETANFLTSQTTVDCFGKGIRPVETKREAILPYCFSIAMENASSDTYFSEKLIDCLLLETVPIYYGCPAITKLLDPDGLLLFQTLDELRELLPRLNRDLYEKMRPALLRNRQTVIDNDWHTSRGMFGRIAQALSEVVDVQRLLSSEFPHEPRGVRRAVNVARRGVRRIASGIHRRLRR
jgi:hypothetical protein